MKKPALIFIFGLLSYSRLFSEEIAFPPELMWWIYEIRKVNAAVEIQDFKFAGETREDIIYYDSLKMLLKYPVLMRWNYSGNYFAYNDYHRADISRTRSGKYRIGAFDDVSYLMIADRNKKVFLCESFGLNKSLDAVYWLTDTVLVGAGEAIYGDTVHVLISRYTIDMKNNKILIKTYFYENAYKTADRKFLKTRWFEHRNDYFED
ncbi:MAG: hypothetical protein LBC67_02745 [Spirochaetales bacterium]|nr:hypothetical protein [Spirochaetales bacterium]